MEEVSRWDKQSSSAHSPGHTSHVMKPQDWLGVEKDGPSLVKRKSGVRGLAPMTPQPRLWTPGNLAHLECSTHVMLARTAPCGLVGSCILCIPTV
jgi:hypothetical protein